MGDSIAVWISAVSAAIGAVATAFAAYMSWRSAERSSQAAEQATRALAMHNQPMVEVSTEDKGSDVLVHVNPMQNIPGRPIALEWWKVTWATFDGRSGVEQVPSSPIRILGVNASQLRRVAIEAKDSQTGLMWELKPREPMLSIFSDYMDLR
jgi:hypothetical protein